jgi:predicted alpha/beta hydrolase family esterase
MKKRALPLLVLGIAGVMLVASPVEANDKTSSKKLSSQSSRPCRKVSVSVISRTNENDKTGNAVSSEPYFNNDYTAQHPSGG